MEQTKVIASAEVSSQLTDRVDVGSQEFGLDKDVRSTLTL